MGPPRHISGELNSQVWMMVVVFEFDTKHRIAANNGFLLLSNCEDRTFAGVEGHLPYTGPLTEPIKIL